MKHTIRPDGRFRSWVPASLTGEADGDTSLPRSRAPSVRSAELCLASCTMYTEPEHVRLAMEGLGVTGIKLGQILSARADLLPPDCIAEFARLREAVPAVSTTTIRDEVAAQFGSPVEELFTQFADEPLASASITKSKRLRRFQAGKETAR